jgi:hypothetical protein
LIGNLCLVNKLLVEVVDEPSADFGVLQNVNDANPLGVALGRGHEIRYW